MSALDKFLNLSAKPSAELEEIIRLNADMPHGPDGKFNAEGGSGQGKQPGSAGGGASRGAGGGAGSRHPDAMSEKQMRAHIIASHGYDRGMLREQNMSPHELHQQLHMFGSGGGHTHGGSDPATWKI